MDKTFPQFKQHLQNLARQLAAEAPTTLGAFGQLHKAAIAPGALDTKTKELIALGIGIASHCHGCIAYHVEAALKAGASRAEVVEAIGVAIMMGGGPAMLYGCEAFEALNQFSAAAQ